jgi:hypothetical protein
VNRVDKPDDPHKARERAGNLDEFSRVILFSFAAEVIAAEPEFFPLLSTESDFMSAIKALAVPITHPCEVRLPEFP